MSIWDDIGKALSGAAQSVEHFLGVGNQPGNAPPPQQQGPVAQAQAPRFNVGGSPLAGGAFSQPPPNVVQPPQQNQQNPNQKKPQQYRGPSLWDVAAHLSGFSPFIQAGQQVAQGVSNPKQFAEGTIQQLSQALTGAPKVAASPTQQDVNPQGQLTSQYYQQTNTQPSQYAPKTAQQKAIDLAQGVATIDAMRGGAQSVPVTAALGGVTGGLNAAANNQNPTQVAQAAAQGAASNALLAGAGSLVHGLFRSPETAPVGVPQVVADDYTGSLQPRDEIGQFAQKPVSPTQTAIYQQLADHQSTITTKIRSLRQGGASEATLQPYIKAEQDLGNQLQQIRAAQPIYDTYQGPLEVGPNPNQAPDEAAQSLKLTNETIAQRQTYHASLNAGLDEALAKNIDKTGAILPGADDILPATKDATNRALDYAANGPKNPVEPYKLPDNLESPKDAITTGLAPASEFHANAVDLVKNTKDLTGRSVQLGRAFRQAIEHPEQADAIGQQLFSKNLDLYNKTLAQAKEVYNLDHAAQMGVDNPRPYFGNYTDHPWDLSNPEQAAKFAELSQLGKGKSAIPRVFPTIDEGEAAGFKLTSEPLYKQMSKWAAYEEHSITNHGLLTQLTKIDPSVNILQDKGGVRWAASDPKVQKAIRGLQPYETNLAGNIYDTANHIGKEATLGGGLFHDLKTSIRNSTSQVGLAVTHPSTIPGLFRNAFEGRASFFNPSAYRSFIEDWNARGGDKIDAYAGFKDQPLGSDLSNPVKATNTVLEKGNFIMNAVNRKINVFKRNTLESYLKAKGITPESFNPQDAAQRALVREAGSQVNDWFGGINHKIAGTPIWRQKAFRRLALASDFTEGKINTVGNFFKGGAAGSLARTQLISEAVGTAVIVEAINKATNGNFVNPLEAILAPQVHTSMTDTKGRKLSVHAPSTIPGDIYNAIKDPAHALTSRVAAIPSILGQGLTGKDYFGNSLVDLSKNPNPNYAQNVIAAAKSRIPIPAAQTQKFLSGKQSGAQSALNELGFRTNLDQTTPQYKATQAYFNTLNAAKQSLSGNDAQALTELLRREKDGNGNTIQLSPLQRIQDAKILYGNDALIKARSDQENAYAKATGKPVDPLYSLPLDKQKVFYNYQSQYTGDADKAKIASDNPWIANLEKTRTQFFSQLPPSSSVPAQGTPQYPKFDTQTTQALNSYNSAAPAQKAQLIQSHPELADAFNKIAQYTNQMRQAEGAPPLANYPQASPQVQAIINAYNNLPKGNGPKGGSPDRAKWIQANPIAYNAMTNYLTQVGVYDLSKSAAQNQFQGSDPTQQFLKSAYDLGQYDIAKNPNGTYSLNPQAAYAQKAAASKSSSFKSSSSTRPIKVRFARNNVKKPHYYSQKLKTYSFRPKLGKVQSARQQAVKIR